MVVILVELSFDDLESMGSGPHSLPLQPSERLHELSVLDML